MVTFIAIYTISLVWGNTNTCNIKCISILKNKYLRSIFKIHYTQNCDNWYFNLNIFKTNDIIKVYIYIYIYIYKVYIYIMV